MLSENKLYEITHGSENSIDKDVYWVMKELPTKEELTKINKKEKTSDINFITINNGKVSSCIKGTIDEINNGIIDTYYLHKQEKINCPIIYRQHRDKFIKSIRFIRGILVQFSKTEYRPIIKKASKSHNLEMKINTAIELISNLEKIENFIRLSKTDLFKYLSFQLAQSKGLFENIEIYTKNNAIKFLKPELGKFINREKYNKKELIILKEEIIDFLKFLKKYYFDILYLQQVNTLVVNENFTFDIRYELYIK